MFNTANTVSLYKDLRSRCKGFVKNYRSDWKHDRCLIRSWLSDSESLASDGFEFVHVARESGTSLYRVRKTGLDISEPYFFSSSTPRRIMEGIAGCFCSSSSMYADCKVHHFDGNVLREITTAQAKAIFMQAASK